MTSGEAADFDGAGEFAVGFDGDNNGAINNDKIASVADNLNSVRSALADVAGDVKLFVRSCIADCTGPASECEACLRGHIANSLDEIAQNVIKAQVGVANAVSTAVQSVRIAGANLVAGLPQDSPILIPVENTADPVTVATPIATDPPPHNPTGPPSGCHCPPGSEWAVEFSPINGLIEYVCKTPSGFKVDAVCDTPPPPPDGGCLDLTTVFHCPDGPNVCFTINGTPATLDEIREHCIRCLISSPELSCDNIVKIIDGDIPDAQVPTPPEQSHEAETCPLRSTEELVTLSYEFDAGQVNESGQDLSTEDDPIWIPDPDNDGEFIEVEIGEPNPGEQEPKSPALNVDGLIKQALRNDGQCQVCEVPQLPQEPPPNNNPVLAWNYCKTDDIKSIDKTYNTYLEIGTRLCSGGLADGWTATKQIFDLLVGGRGNFSVTDSVPFATEAAVLFKNLVSNCWYRKIYAASLPRPAGCSDLTESAIDTIRTMYGRYASKNEQEQPHIKAAVDYLANYGCQYVLPTADGFTSLFTGGIIDKETWTYGQRINARCVPWAEKQLELIRPTPDANTVFGWARAEVIDDEEKNKLLKRLGLYESYDIDNFEYMSHAIPGINDLVRFMTRDVADEDVVAKFGYDDFFDDKWTGKIKEWGQRQNFTDEAAKAYWRAHWQLPAISQVYEMHHRLRPEKGLVDSNDNPLTVSKEDVADVLRINDMSPGWVDKLVAISERIPGLRQIRNLYETDVWEKDQVQSAFQDQGFSLDNAKSLADWLVIGSAESKARQTGRVGPNLALNAFLEGAIDANNYTQLLTEVGIPDDIAKNIVRVARGKANIADQKQRAAALKKAFIGGAFGEGQYKTKLMNAGTDADRADQIVSRDKDIKDSRFKPIQMSKMCHLVGQGYMSMDDYMSRARNLGYSDADASLMAASCAADIQEKKQAQVEKELRAELAKVEKAAKRQRKVDKELRAFYRSQFPCKNKAKGDCPPGVEPPAADTIESILSQP